MHTLILIAVGGAIGSLLRFTITELVVKTGFSMPWGTILVNLTGCFIIGLIWGVFNTLEIGYNTRLFVFVGLLGSFTTFSTFALENFHLLRNEDIPFMVFNISISNVAGILLVFAGFYISKILFRVS